MDVKMGPEEICKLFTETALKPDKCIDFDLKYVSTDGLHKLPLN